MHLPRHPRHFNNMHHFDLITTNNPTITTTSTKLLHSHRPKPPRFHLTLPHRLSLNPNPSPLLPTAALESYLKLSSLVDSLTTKQAISQVAAEIQSDMYLRRYCRDSEMAVFRKEVRRMLMAVVGLLRKGVEEEEEGEAEGARLAEAEAVMEVCRFALDCEVGFSKDQTEMICDRLMLLCLQSPTTTTTINTLFPQINFLLHSLLTKHHHEPLYDCYCSPNFKPLFASLTHLNCSEAAVTLLPLLASPKNMVMFRQFKWAEEQFERVCEAVVESIRRLTNGEEIGEELEGYAMKLLPKSIEIMENLGFVCGSKMFQQAYWSFNLEGLLRLKVRLGKATIHDAEHFLQLLSDYDYCPNSAITLLAQLCTMCQTFPELLGQEFCELVEHLGLIMETGGIRQGVCNTIFEAFCLKGTGFINTIIQKIFQLRWDLLAVVEALLNREDGYQMQYYLMRNELIDFLFQSLVKGKISLPFLKQAYKVLTLFLLDNPVSFCYLCYLLKKHQPPSITYLPFPQLLSSRLGCSCPFVTSILAGQSLTQHFLKTPPRPILQTSQWFLAATLARRSIPQQHLEFTLLRIVVWLGCEDREGVVEGLGVYGMIKVMKDEGIGIAEERLLEEGGRIKQEVRGDLGRWVHWYDGTGNWELVQRISRMYYCQLRKTAIEIMEYLQ